MFLHEIVIIKYQNSRQNGQTIEKIGMLDALCLK